MFGTLEVFARSKAAEKVFPLRSYGNYHAQFEIKWHKLEQYVNENSGVDVILLGSSMVNTGIDPSVFTDTLTPSGTKLRVFNFGVEGLTVVPMAQLARLLVDTYHPGTIIYFTEMRDYLAGNGDDVAQSFLANEWLQYRMGQKSFVGWAVDHSSALQLLLPLRTWARADFPDTFLLNQRRQQNTHADGYEPEIQVVDFSGAPPDPNDPEDQKLFALYGNFAIAPERLDYLKQLLALSNTGTAILVTEFPAYPAFYHYFGGEHVHQLYLDAIQEFIANQGGAFLPPVNPVLIPLNGRSDDHHLNQIGAELYSSLLGQQFNLLCQQQAICLERK
ncbi:MAG TPA: hypothetical protein VFF78_02670 [Anaerolineaceae bacterium]|nr:hypothetical protein [Anaerolineaceae bacterium]